MFCATANLYNGLSSRNFFRARHPEEGTVTVDSEKNSADEDPLVSSIRDRVQLSLASVQQLASEAEWENTPTNSMPR
jgi:hypothetical protein